MEKLLALVTLLLVAFAFAAPGVSAKEAGYEREEAPSGCGGLHSQYAPPPPQFGTYAPSQYQYGSGLPAQAYDSGCKQHGPDQQSSQYCEQYGGCVGQGPPAVTGVGHAVDEFVEDSSGASDDLSGAVPEAGRHGPGAEYDQYGPGEQYGEYEDPGTRSGDQYGLGSSGQYDRYGSGYEQYTPGSSQYGSGDPGASQYECDQYGTCDAAEAAAGVDVIGKATEDAHGASGDLAESIPQAGSVGPAADAGDAQYAGVDATGDTAADATGGSDELAGAAGGGADGSSATSAGDEQPPGQSGASPDAAEMSPAGDEPAPPDEAENVPREVTPVAEVAPEEAGDAPHEEVTPVAEVEAPSVMGDPPSEEDEAEVFFRLSPVSGMVALTSTFALLLALLVGVRIFRYR